jgi:hypothetical protein
MRRQVADGGGDAVAELGVAGRGRVHAVGAHLVVELEPVDVARAGRLHGPLNDRCVAVQVRVVVAEGSGARVEGADDRDFGLRCLRADEGERPGERGGDLLRAVGDVVEPALHEHLVHRGRQWRGREPGLVRSAGSGVDVTGAGIAAHRVEPPAQVEGGVPLPRVLGVGAEGGGVGVTDDGRGDRRRRDARTPEVPTGEADEGQEDGDGLGADDHVRCSSRAAVLVGR